jgi:uncharacterized protein YhbP (UPF0306 family)
MDPREALDVTLWKSPDHPATVAAQHLLRNELLSSFALDGQHAHLWTAFFAWDLNRSLVLLTSPKSRHGTAMRPGVRIGGSIARQVSAWGDPIAGLQWRGRITDAAQEPLQDTYAEKFAQYASWIDCGGETESLFYSIELDWMKVIDETMLGEEKFFEIGCWHE